MARMNNKDRSLYREMLQEIEDAKTGPATPNYRACLIYSTQRSSDEPISGSKSTLEYLPIVKGDEIKRLLKSFWEKLQAEDISEQKAKAKMEDMFKELICVSANEVLRALVTRKSLYECSPGKVQVSQTGVRGSLSPIFRTFIKTTSTEEFIALDGVIKLLCTEVTHTVNSVLKDNCGFESILLVEEKDYSTPRRTLRHIAANAPMFLPHMTFSDQQEKLLEAEISKALTENELKTGVLDSENKATEGSDSEQERVMSEFSERNPSPGRPLVSVESLCEEQMTAKQEKCEILSHGDIMLQSDSPGVPHDETETQFKTEQTSSCEPAQNQEPAPQSSLNQEPAPQSSLNQEPAPLSSLNQEPAPQSSLNQEPAPQSSLNQEPAPLSSLNQEPAPQSFLTKSGPKKRRKRKPAKDLQGGLEEAKTPIESFSTSERGKSPPIAPAQGEITETQQVKTIRYNLPSDERERSPPIAIRYNLPSDERERSPPIAIRYNLPSDERERSPPIAIRYNLPSDERERSPPIAIRYNLPSDERERSSPIAIRYSLPSDAPFMPLQLIPDQGSTQIIKNHEISSQWETRHIHNLAWEVARHILQEKHLSEAHPLVTKLFQRLKEHMWEWNVKESPNHIKKIACDIYRDLCSRSTKEWIHFHALIAEDEIDNIITEIHNHLVRPKKRGKLSSFFHSIRHALCRYC